MSIHNILARWSKATAASLLLCANVTVASAAPVQTTAKYIVSLAGVNVASLAIDFSDNGSAYEIDINANVSGVGSLVASGTANATSNGGIGKRLQPNSFNIQTHTKTDGIKVGVQFSNGGASGFQVDPPIINNVNRVAIERKDLRNVIDPLSAFMIKGDSLSPALCNQTLKVFTGIERYNLNMSFAETQTATSKRTGYQGPVVLCQLRYVPVSGHFTTSEMTAYLADTRRFLVWFAPLNDSGYFIPYRVLLGTSVGDLSMVLTGLK